MNSTMDTINEQIVSLRKEGYTQKEVAEQLSVTKDKVVYVLKKAKMKEFKYQRSCKNCNKRYETIRHSSKFCSESCRGKHNKRNNGTKQTCNWCKEEFVNYKVRACCSKECRRAYENHNKNQRLLAERLVKAIDPNRHKQCEFCRDSFYACNAGRRFCSNYCRYKSKHQPSQYNHKCKGCGKHYIDNRKNSGGCSDECRRKLKNRYKETRKRQYKKNGDIDYDISLGLLMIREKGICYLCNNEVNINVGTNHDYYPSIEHMIPITKGGTHTWENVRLAHRICNSFKSDGISEGASEKQLALF